MGQSVWFLAAPVALLIAAFWLRQSSPGSDAQTAVAWAAFGVSGAFVLWALAGKARGEAV
jgi:hypothetical protein